MRNRRFLYCFVFAFCASPVVRAQPGAMPVSSKPELFTFFDKGSSSMPLGSSANSSAILMLDGTDYDMGGGRGTAFIIRTFRDDEKVCVCMTGHQVKALFPEGTTPTPPVSIHMNKDVYMNFFGADMLEATTVPPDDDYEHVPAEPKTDIRGFRKSFLASAKLVAYSCEDLVNPGDADAALLLVDKKRLPADAFAALGYDFADNAGAWAGYFYSLGHPLSYPMRISDKLQIVANSTYFVDAESRLPYATAGGASGAPMISRPTEGSANGVVRGIIAAQRDPQTFRSVGRDGRSRNYTYSIESVATKISFLESAIREHCWNQRDRATIASTGSYKQTVTVNNAQPALDQNQTVNTATDISGSAAAFTESTTDGVQVTQLMANNCTIVSTASGTLALPTAYPGTTTPWQVVVVASQVNVNPGFSYTVSGSSELDLTTVDSKVYSGFTSRTTNNADTASSVAGAGNLPGFRLYPNPSPDGTFYIEVPAAATSVVYKGSVLSADGKLVQQLNDLQSGQKVTLHLSHLPRGVYMLSVQTPEGKRVFSRQLVCP